MSDQFVSMRDDLGRRTLVVSPRHGEGHYYATGTDDQDVIMEALQHAADQGSEPPVVYLAEGTYQCSSYIAIPDAPNLALVGAGRGRTVLEYDSGFGEGSAIIATPLSSRFKYSITDLTIDLSATSFAGGIQFEQISNSNIERIAIIGNSTSSAIYLANGCLFNRFNDIDIQEAGEGVTIAAGAATTNENTFFGVKCTKKSGGTGVTRCVNIGTNAGNNNHFIACSFEDFVTGVEVDGDGNTFTDCRIESNNQTGTIVYIKLGSSSNNNSFKDCYLAGNEWVSRASSITDAGTGNNFYLLNNVQDQHIIARRNVVTADHLAQFVRSGSGDGTGVVVAEDTYATSGTPTQFLAKGVRAAGKFFEGLLSGVSKWWVDGNGDSYQAGKHNFDNLSGDLGANPSVGSFLYSLSGALKYRGSAGDGGAGGNRFLHNRDVEVVAAGTAASLTGSMATLDFGTTDPSVSVPSAGTWLVWVTVQLELNAATYAAGEYTISVKLRNTSDSTDLGETYVIPILRAVTGITTTTATIGTFTFPVKFSLSSAKTVAIQAQVSSTPSAGSVQASKAKITGLRLF